MDRAKLKAHVDTLYSDDVESHETALLELHGMVSRATCKHNFDPTAVLETKLLQLLLKRVLREQPCAEGASIPSSVFKRQLSVLDMLAGDDKDEYGLLYWASARGALITVALGPECEAFTQLRGLLLFLASSPAEQQPDCGAVLASASRTLIRLVLRADGLYTAYAISAEEVAQAVTSGALPALAKAFAAYITVALMESSVDVVGPPPAPSALRGGGGAVGAASRTLQRSFTTKQAHARSVSQRKRERQHKQQIAAASVAYAVMQSIGYVCQSLAPQELKETGVQELVLTPVLALLAGLPASLMMAEKSAADAAAAAAQAASACAAAVAAAAAKATPTRKKASDLEHGNVAIRLSYIGEEGEATEMSGGVGGSGPGGTAVKLPRAPPASVVSGLLVRALDGLIHCVENRSAARADPARQIRLIATLMSLGAGVDGGGGGGDGGSGAVPPLLQLIRSLSSSLEQQEEEQREALAATSRHGGGGSAASGSSHGGAHSHLIHAAPGLGQQGHAESKKVRGMLHSVRHSLAPYKVLFQLQTLCQQSMTTGLGGSVAVSLNSEVTLAELVDELEDVSTVAVRATLMPTLLARGDLHQAVDTAGALEDLFRHLPAAGQTALAGVLAEAAAQPSAPLGLVVAVAAAAGAMTAGQAGQPQEHAAGKSGTSGPRQKKQPQLQTSSSSHGHGTQAALAAGAATATASTATTNFRVAAQVATFLNNLENAYCGGPVQPVSEEAATSLMGSLPAAMMVGRMHELATHHKAQSVGSKSIVVRAGATTGGHGAGLLAHAPVGLIEAVLVGLAENLHSFLTAAAELLPPSDASSGVNGDLGAEGGIGHAGHVDELVGLVCRCTQRFQERLPVVLQHLQAHLQTDANDADNDAADGTHGTGAGSAGGATHQGQDLLVSTACVAATRVLEACTNQLTGAAPPTSGGQPQTPPPLNADAALGDQPAAALRILAIIIKSSRAPLHARLQACATAAQALKKLLLTEWTAGCGGLSSSLSVSNTAATTAAGSAASAANGSGAAAAGSSTKSDGDTASTKGDGSTTNTTAFSNVVVAAAAANGGSAATATHPLLLHDATEAAQSCVDALFGVLSDSAMHSAEPDLFEDDVCAGLAVSLSELRPVNPLAAALDVKHSLVVAARALKALVKSVPHGQLTSEQETLLRCFVNAHDDGLQHSAFNLDLLFAEGAVAVLLRRLHDTPPEQPLEEEALQFFASLTDWVPACRHRLRDLGLLKRVIRRMESHSCGGFELVLLVSICKGMSESESLHTFMKELGLARALAAKLVADDQADGAAADTLLTIGSTGGLDALLTLANLNGGTSSPDDTLCQELIVRHDISVQIAQFASQAALSDKGLATYTFPDGTWSIYDLPSLLISCQSLTRTAVNCERFVQHGLLPTLLHVLKSSSGNGETAAASATAGSGSGAGADNAATNAAGSSGSTIIAGAPPAPRNVLSDPQLVVLAARTLFNMSQVSGIHAQLREAGVQEVLKACLKREDLRVVDAARGTLLQLGELTDTAATRALKASCADVAPPPPAAAAAAAAPTSNDVGGNDWTGPPLYDVFLSHKRTDARDFARALWNLLVSNGYAVFLDFEFKQELGSLEEMVGHCTHFLFIMTDNVFKSEWCIKELVAAVKANVNIVLLIKDGARWPDLEGNPVCDFPPPHLLRTLPPEVQPIFTRKPVVHNDEYYRAFVEALFDKLYRPRPLTPPMTPPMNPIPDPLDLMDPAAAAAAAAAGLPMPLPLPQSTSGSSGSPSPSHIRSVSSAHARQSAHHPHARGPSAHLHPHGPTSAHLRQSAHAHHHNSAHAGAGASGYLPHPPHHITSASHLHHLGSKGHHHNHHPGLYGGDGSSAGHQHHLSADGHLLPHDPHHAAAAAAAAAAAFAAAAHGGMHNPAAAYQMIANPWPAAATAAEAAVIMNASIHHPHHPNSVASASMAVHQHQQQAAVAALAAAAAAGGGGGGSDLQLQQQAALQQGMSGEGGSAGLLPRPPHLLFHQALSDPGAFSVAADAATMAAGKTQGALTELQAELSNARRELISEVTGLGRSLFSSQQELRQTLQAEVASSVRMVSGEVRSLLLDAQSQIHNLKVELTDVRQELITSRHQHSEMRGMLAQVLEAVGTLMQHNVQLESLLAGGHVSSMSPHPANHGHGHHHSHNLAPVAAAAAAGLTRVNSSGSTSGVAMRRARVSSCLGYGPDNGSDFESAGGGIMPPPGIRSRSSVNGILSYDSSAASLQPAGHYSPRLNSNMTNVNGGGGSYSGGGAGAMVSAFSVPATSGSQSDSVVQSAVDSPRVGRRYMSQPQVMKDMTAIEPAGTMLPGAGGAGPHLLPVAVAGNGGVPAMGLVHSNSANSAIGSGGGAAANAVGVVLPPISVSAVLHHHMLQQPQQPMLQPHPPPPSQAAVAAAAMTAAAVVVATGAGGPGGGGGAAIPAGIMGGGFQLRSAINQVPATGQWRKGRT